MAIRALDFMAKLSSRFAYEILPVTMASVIGAILVNHYGHQPPSPPIVVQAPASASEDAIVQSLRDEHEFIASFMKRNQERRERRRTVQRAPRRRSHRSPRLPFRSWIRRCPSQDRRRKKRRRGSRQNPRSGKSPRRRRRRRLEPDPPVVISEPCRSTLPRRRRLKLSSSRDRGRSSASPAPWASWVADVAQAPARVAFMPSLARLVLDAAARYGR